MTKPVKKAKKAPLIALNNVYRSFDTDDGVIPVLQDVNLEMYPREVLCLVGESGCGKSTTGKIIANLLPPSAGEVLVNGVPLDAYRGKEKKAVRRSMQIVHQDPFASLNPAHTIGQILSFPLKRHKMVNGRAELRRRIWELLDLVDLTPPGDIVNKYPHQLSGGQRQRVSIARALTVDPQLIVADEAVSMVDVSIRIGLLRMLHELSEMLDLAILFITHDLALAKYFGWDGRLAVMYLGRIVEIGRTPDIIRNPAHPYTKALLSAVPEADPSITRKKEIMRLRSSAIPSLTDIPSGCAFHPRCPFFQPGVCDNGVPVLESPPTHTQQVACTVINEQGELTPYEDNA
jgi:peptide/nickel transport system ATP-binding protein